METLRAVTILIGCTIGAGVLGIPYAIYKAGFITGLLVLVILGLVMLMINLYLGEVTLRTKKTHQLPGYAKLYLGDWGNKLMNIIMTIHIYGALVAYLLGQGEVLSNFFSIQPHVGIFIFFLIGGILVYTGLKGIDKAEGWLVLIIVLITILLFAFSFTKLNTADLTGFSLAKIFIPYGVILFAFNGMVAVPEMKEELVKNKKSLKKCILYGTLTPVVLYILFAFTVIGTSSAFFSPDTTMANLVIGKSMGDIAELSLNVFTLLALTTSFLALGLGLKWQFQFDLKLGKNLAWSLALLPPLLIALLGLTTFIKALGFVGAFCGGTEAILIVLMHKKAKENSQRKPEYSITHNQILSYALIFILGLGIIIGTVSI